MRGGSPGQRRRGGVPGIDETPADAGSGCDIFSFRDASVWYVAGLVRPSMNSTDAPLKQSVPADAGYTFALPVYFGRAGTIKKTAMSIAAPGPGGEYRYAFAWYSNTAPSRLGPGSPLWYTSKSVSAADDPTAHGLNVEPRAGYQFYPNLEVERDTLLWALMTWNDKAATWGTNYYPTITGFAPILGAIQVINPPSSYGRHSVGYKKGSLGFTAVTVGGAAPVLNWDASLLGQTLDDSLSSQGGSSSNANIPAIYYQFEASE